MVKFPCQATIPYLKHNYAEKYAVRIKSSRQQYKANSKKGGRQLN
jgi:hypothetical protein